MVEYQTLSTGVDFHQVKECAPPTPRPILNHGLYTKALNALKPLQECQAISDMMGEARSIRIGAKTFVLDQAGEPDKPGTVRKPGVRRLPQGGNAKKRWGSL